MTSNLSVLLWFDLPVLQIFLFIRRQHCTSHAGTVDQQTLGFEQLEYLRPPNQARAAHVLRLSKEMPSNCQNGNVSSNMPVKKMHWLAELLRWKKRAVCVKFHLRHPRDKQTKRHPRLSFCLFVSKMEFDTRHLVTSCFQCPVQMFLLTYFVWKLAYEGVII